MGHILDYKQSRESLHQTIVCSSGRMLAEWDDDFKAAAGIGMMARVLEDGPVLCAARG